MMVWNERDEDGRLGRFLRALQGADRKLRLDRIEVVFIVGFTLGLTAAAVVFVLMGWIG